MGNSVLRLTPNYDPNPLDAKGNPTGAPPAGAAWTKTPYDVAGPFTVNFQFQMSAPCVTLAYCVTDRGHGGDGIAFLIQDSSTPGPYSTGSGDTALGEGAGGMGFLGIKDSVAVMLDTYQNTGPDYYGNPQQRLHRGEDPRTGFNVPHHFCTDKQLTDIPNGVSDLGSTNGVCDANPTLGMTGSGSPALSLINQNMDDGYVHDLGITYLPGPRR